MISSMFTRFMVCLFFLSFSIYSYLDKHNSCTALRMSLPKITKEIEAIREGNANLQYQIECFENPQHLLDIASRKEFAHLKFPFTQEVLTVNEGLALQSGTPGDDAAETAKGKAAIVIGANP
jgi:hypothetical protein